MDMTLGPILYVIITVLVALVSLAVGLIAYVINSVAYMRLNKKLGRVCHPILTWIPLLQELVLGKLADAVSLKKDGKKKNLSRLMPLALILVVIGWLAMLICAVIGALFALWRFPTAYLIILSILLALIYLVMLIAVVLYLVVWYVAFFRTSRAFLPTWGSWLALVLLVLWPQLSCVALLVMGFFKLKTDDMLEGSYTE